jgi:hypothetical protein
MPSKILLTPRRFMPATALAAASPKKNVTAIAADAVLSEIISGEMSIFKLYE